MAKTLGLAVLGLAAAILLATVSGCVRVVPTGGLISKAEAAAGMVVKPAKGWEVNSRPVWSPDGQRIAYSLTRKKAGGQGEESSPLSVRAELSRFYVRDLKTLTDTYVGEGWSDEGAAFVKGGLLLVTGKPVASDIEKWDAGTRSSKVLYKKPKDALLNDVAWSPQGDRMAVDLLRNVKECTAATPEVGLVDMHGKTTTIWSGKGQSISGLQWSRDGKLLWKDLGEEGTTGLRAGESQLCIAEGPGMKVHIVKPSVKGLEITQGALSPDGRKMAAYATEPGRSGSASLSIYVVDMATGKATQIRSTPKEWAAPGQGCTWSPDGQSIAFSGSKGNGVLSAYLRLVSPTGGKATELVGPLGAWIDSISWAPKSKRLAYVVDGRIYVIDAPAGK